MCIKVPYQYTIYHMYWFWIDDHFIYDAKNSLKYWFLCGFFNNFIRCVLHRITKNICYILSLLYHSYTYRLSLSYDLSIPLSPFPYVSLFPLTIFFFLAILNLSSKLRVWSNPANYVNILYFIVGLSDVCLKRASSSRWTFFYSSNKKWPHIELFHESNFTIYAYTFSLISWTASIVYMVIK